MRKKCHERGLISGALQWRRRQLARPSDGARRSGFARNFSSWFKVRPAACLDLRCTLVSLNNPEYVSQPLASPFASWRPVCNCGGRCSRCSGRSQKIPEACCKATERRTTWLLPSPGAWSVFGTTNAWTPTPRKPELDFSTEDCGSTAASRIKVCTF